MLFLSNCDRYRFHNTLKKEKRKQTKTFSRSCARALKENDRVKEGQRKNGRQCASLSGERRKDEQKEERKTKGRKRGEEMKAVE